MDPNRKSPLTLTFCNRFRFLRLLQSPPHSPAPPRNPPTSLPRNPRSSKFSRGPKFRILHAIPMTHRATIHELHQRIDPSSYKPEHLLDVHPVSYVRHHDPRYVSICPQFFVYSFVADPHTSLRAHGYRGRLNFCIPQKNSWNRTPCRRSEARSRSGNSPTRNTVEIIIISIPSLEGRKTWHRIHKTTSTDSQASLE